MLNCRTLTYSLFKTVVNRVILYWQALFEVAAGLGFALGAPLGGILYEVNDETML